MDIKSRAVFFKYKVKQEYEVTIYYENGLIQDTTEDKQNAVEDDILALAFNEDGLVVRTDEEAENSNAFIAYITTHDPEIEMSYHIQGRLPKEIETVLIERKLNG